MSVGINFYGSLWKEILSKQMVGLEYSLGRLPGRGVFELGFERCIALTRINRDKRIWQREQQNPGAQSKEAHGACGEFSRVAGV